MKHQLTINTKFLPDDRVYEKDDPDKKPIRVKAIIIKKGGLFMYLLTNECVRYSFDIEFWPPEKNNSQNI